MSEFLQQLESGLRDCRLEGRRALLAVSGGADSVAMLRRTVDLRDAMGLVLHVAHFDHRLRGVESAADAAWVERLAATLNVPVTVGGEDVRSHADSKGIGIEEAARSLRYGFLEKTAIEARCTHILVAHTADDQAETILHHIVRGTGLAGLSGMRAERTLASGVIVSRPMLGITRKTIEAYLKELDQDVRTDDSNRDERFTRNRIRQSLLPTLRQDYNPQVDQALRKLGQQAGEVQAALEFVAANLLERALLDKNESSSRLDCEVLESQPRHLIRECFGLLWKTLDWPRQRMGFAEWDRLAELTVIDEGTATLPGEIEARRRGKLLMLQRK